MGKAVRVAAGAASLLEEGNAIEAPEGPLQATSKEMMINEQPISRTLSILCLNLPNRCS